MENRINTKKKYIKNLLLVVTLFASSNAMAEWTFVESVSLGRAEMDIVDFQTFAGFVTKKVNNVKFSTLNISLTAARNKFYVSVNTELPLSDKSYQFTEQGRNTVRTVEREDLGLTLGYNIYKGVSLFGGLSYGSNHYINTNADEPGTVTDIKETDVGPFLGASYAHDFNRFGNVSATLAYALLDGEIDSNDSTNSLISNKGDTSGLSLTLTYFNKYNNDIDYFAAFKVKNYEYDNVSSGGTPVNIVKEKNFVLISGGIIIY